MISTLNIKTWWQLTKYTFKSWLLLATVSFSSLIGLLIAYVLSAVFLNNGLSLLIAIIVLILIAIICFCKPKNRMQVHLALSVLFSVMASCASFFISAKLTNSISLIITISVLIFCLSLEGLSRSVTRRKKFRGKRLLPWVITGETLILLGILVSQMVFKPFNLPEPLQPSVPDARYWKLSTGSEIAYIHVPASGKAKPFPIIYLHGGPGGEISETHRQIFGRLAKNGFDVYLYDQVGGGLSERLSNIKNYTVSRHVSDLEAIRQQLDADQIILIGHSWGGELAANYLATYPERVAKVVFSSPVAMWRPALKGTKYSLNRLSPEEEAKAERFLLRYYFSPRFITHVILFWLNPEAAHNFIGDREMESWQSAWTKLIFSKAFCNIKNKATFPPNIGAYAFMMTSIDADKSEDIRPALKQNQTPALILRGECDYLIWEHVKQYNQTLPNSTLLYLENAGHIAYLEKPKLYIESVRAFLLDQPLPIAPHR